jgi:hypothetical protein
LASTTPRERQWLRLASARLGLQPVGQLGGGAAAARGQVARHRQDLRQRLGALGGPLGDRRGGFGGRGSFGDGRDLGLRDHGIGFRDHARGLLVQHVLVQLRLEFGERRLRPVCGGRYVFLDDDVGVGAAETEAGDADGRCAAVARELGGLVDDLQVRLVPRNVGVRTGVADVRRNDVVLQRHDHLRQARRTGARLQVTEVGLGRTEQRGLVGVAAAADHPAERVRLDRVAEQGAGAVRLDVVDRGRRDARVAVGAAQYLGLSVGIRGEQAVGPPVVVDRRALDHGVDRVAVALGVGEALQHHQTAALGADHAVGVAGERLDVPVLGEAAVRVEAERGHRREQHVHAAGQRQVGLAAAQRLHRLVHRHQRRGAGGVDGHRRAAEVEEVGDPVRDDRADAAHDRVRLGRHRHVRIALAAQPERREQHEVVARGTDEHADRLALEIAGRNPRVLQRLPGQLHRQALLRIHPLDLDRRHGEELGVEAFDDFLVEVAALGVGLLDRLGQLRLGQELRPASLGQLPDAVTTADEEIPGRLRGVTRAGQPGRQTHDGDVVRLTRTVARGVEGVVRGFLRRVRLAVDDPLGQRGDGRVLVHDRRVQHHAGQFLDVPTEGEGIARGEPELLHRPVHSDLLDRLPGRLGDPAPQPLTQLRHRHVGLRDTLRGLGRGRRVGAGLGGRGVGRLGGRALVVSHQFLKLPVSVPGVP